ncbi:COG3772 Phage-related lysozyme (muraminidase) [uncultured Caudovirales phage]|uniref:Endolysin n=1 Tax=uncultured Caudovirales phage TaxID=2100421 RepID=A0A6J7WDZ7_9CAUD|nr:COG3772 Phage-related lysozyme (muraminidase) [uncultured Caudovirales phage]
MISPKALQTIKHHEGVRFKPYRCPAKLWTIGVGHVLYPEQGKLKLEDRMSVELRPSDSRVFTPKEVDAILAKDLERFVRGVLTYCPTAGARQGWMDALVSFSFNVGLGTLQRSTLRQKHNRGDYEGAADELLKYCKAGGKVLKGLENRRKDERALYLSA